MYRSRIAAASVAAAVAMTTASVPAQALETSIKDSTCTVDFTATEKEAWDAAVKQSNDIDEAGVMPLKVKVAEAKAVKSAFQKKMEELDLKLSEAETQKGSDLWSEDQIKLFEGNIAVIKQLQARRGAYEKALDACAANRTYDSVQDKTEEVPGATVDADNRNTSSNMDESLLYTLVGLLGLAGLTSIVAVVLNGGFKLPKLPF